MNMTDEDRKMALRNAHIPTSELIKDIEDTEAEIVTMEKEAEHLEKTPLSLPTARIDHMKASARRSGIKERQEFIQKLNTILEYRREEEAVYN